ncbi:hypothetical protein GJ496_004075 [Pomphorhynchus laevis]|nr:hypothetical protein GJ496_004075 [Pomphorhynchus laevis]
MNKNRLIKNDNPENGVTAFLPQLCPLNIIPSSEFPSLWLISSGQLVFKLSETDICELYQLNSENQSVRLYSTSVGCSVSLSSAREAAFKSLYCTAVHNNSGSFQMNVYHGISISIYNDRNICIYNYITNESLTYQSSTQLWRKSGNILAELPADPTLSILETGNRKSSRCRNNNVNCIHQTDAIVYQIADTIKIKKWKQENGLISVKMNEQGELSMNAGIQYILFLIDNVRVCQQQVLYTTKGIASQNICVDVNLTGLSLRYRYINAIDFQIIFSFDKGACFRYTTCHGIQEIA